MAKQERQTGQVDSEHSKVSAERTRIQDEIRSLLRYYYRPREICEKLRLSRSQYYVHIKAIKRQDQKYIDALRGQDFASVVRSGIETLEDCSRQLAAIAQDARKDADKIAAIGLRYQIGLDILNVCKVGPSAVPIGT